MKFKDRIKILSDMQGVKNLPPPHSFMGNYRMCQQNMGVKTEGGTDAIQNGIKDRILVKEAPG